MNLCVPQTDGLKPISCPFCQHRALQQHGVPANTSCLVTNLLKEEGVTALQDAVPISKSIIYANALSKALPQMFLIKPT